MPSKTPDSRSPMRPGVGSAVSIGHALTPSQRPSLVSSQAVEIKLRDAGEEGASTRHTNAFPDGHHVARSIRVDDALD
jgi:hypothetical protein